MTIIVESRNHGLERALSGVLLLSVAGVFSLGCPAQSVRPDDNSAIEHREEAGRARASADAHRAARRARVVDAAAPGNAEAAGLPVMQASRGDGDTNWHLLEAARHALHARQHQSAAETLERAEAAECRGLPVAKRSACPILMFVTELREIDGGIRVHFGAQANVGQIVTLMKCHLAFARVRGFDRVPACPLYVKGVEIRRGSDDHAVDVIGNSPAVTAEIRARIPEVVSVGR